MFMAGRTMKPEDVLKGISEFETLFLTIYGEGRGEPIEGQVAIGNVIRNRFDASHNKEETYKTICLAPHQFSCWNHDDPNFPLLIELGEALLTGAPLRDIVLRQCVYVARGIKEGEIMDNTHHALNYMTTKLFNSKDKPNWATNVKVAKSIGNHSFLVV
jgi:hypothetical protein